MIGLTSQIRIGLVATYVALILLGVAALRIMFLHYNGAVHPALGIIAIGSHALPLLLTKFLQDLRNPTGKVRSFSLQSSPRNGLPYWPFQSLLAPGPAEECAV
jgi:hypothetical protein